MIAAGAALAEGHSAKLGGPNYQRILKHAARL
jgi:hypothetical protein